MSAPPSYRLLALIAMLCVALLTAGCAVPGKGRLQRPPDELPASLSYVTADVLGYSLYDTDPESERWTALGGQVDAEQQLRSLHSPLFGGHDVELSQVGQWIGSSAGVAVRQLDLDGRTGTSTLYFADVADHERLEQFLERRGWQRRPRADRPLEDHRLSIWTNRHECRERQRIDITCASPSRPLHTAVAVGEQGIVAARTSAALDQLLDAAERYPVPERQAMSEFTVEAAEAVPVAAVFRTDLLRTQVRRPFEHDPALLELARWATSSNSLVAMRDGWIGIAPPIDAERDAVRVVGTANWIPDLAPELQLLPAERGMLDGISSDVDLAVALHDPGQHLADVLRGITFNSLRYSTEQDVPEGEPRVELLPLLERLDGDAAIGWSRDGHALSARVQVDHPRELVPLVERALDTAGFGGSSRVRSAGDVLELRVSGRRATRIEGGGVAHEQAVDAAGRPPSRPVAWLWKAAGSCTGPAGGWVSWNELDRLAWSVHLELGAGCPAGERPAWLPRFLAERRAAG